jgi:hypothetical protein
MAVAEMEEVEGRLMGLGETRCFIHIVVGCDYLDSQVSGSMVRTAFSLGKRHLI